MNFFKSKIVERERYRNPHLAQTIVPVNPRYHQVTLINTANETSHKETTEGDDTKIDVGLVEKADEKHLIYLSREKSRRHRHHKLKDDDWSDESDEDPRPEKRTHRHTRRHSNKSKNRDNKTRWRAFALIAVAVLVLASILLIRFASTNADELPSPLAQSNNSSSFAEATLQSEPTLATTPTALDLDTTTSRQAQKTLSSGAKATHTGNNTTSRNSTNTAPPRVTGIWIDLSQAKMRKKHK